MGTVDNKLHPVLSLSIWQFQSYPKHGMENSKSPNTLTNFLIYFGFSTDNKMGTGKKKKTSVSGKKRHTRTTCFTELYQLTRKMCLSIFDMRETNMSMSSFSLFFWEEKNKRIKYHQHFPPNRQDLLTGVRAAGEGDGPLITGVSLQWTSQLRYLPLGSSPPGAHFWISPETSCFLLLHLAQKVQQNVPGRHKKQRHW